MNFLFPNSWSKSVPVSRIRLILAARHTHLVLEMIMVHFLYVTHVDQEPIPWQDPSLRNSLRFTCSSNPLSPGAPGPLPLPSISTSPRMNFTAQTLWHRDSGASFSDPLPGKDCTWCTSPQIFAANVFTWKKNLSIIKILLKLRWHYRWLFYQDHKSKVG